MPDKYRCPVCRKDVAPTAQKRFRKHDKESGVECDMSGVIIPGHVLKAGPSTPSDAPLKGRDYADCPACGRTPILDEQGRFGRHKILPRGNEECPMSGEEYAQAGASEEGKEPCQTTQSQALTTTPNPSSEPSGGTLPERDSSPETAPTPDSMTNDAPPTPAAAPDPLTSAPTNAQTSIARSQGTATVTEAAPVTESAPASTERTLASVEFMQPAPPFEQPGRTARVLAQAVPMTDHGREIAARIKETFYAYTNRLDRSQQTTMGPSEIGSPCDRRIAMSLLRVNPVNPGGDNWASFVGTCVHAGLAEMFLWANANTGRYAVEVPLKFPNAYVPHGTGDLLDRTLCMFLDHKLMGRWSLDKLSTKGPSPTYRVQVHTYAYGAQLKGERIDHVAIIGWPREAGTLDDLYVWTEPYDPSIAIDALARVERIAKRVQEVNGTPLERVKGFSVADDCRFCPYHAPKDQAMERGCNGKAGT